MLNKQEYYFSHSGQGNKRLRRAFCVVLHLAEQNYSGTALFLVHVVLLMTVISTINTKFTCRKIFLTETATQRTEKSPLFSSGYKQTITPTRKNFAPAMSGVASPLSLQQR